MNGKLSLKLIITESFLPFILLLLLLFFFLNYIDAVIEERSEQALNIRLDTGTVEEEKESLLAEVKLSAERYPAKYTDQVVRINSHLKKKNYSRIISLLKKMPAEFRNVTDSLIVLAFSYYKVDQSNKGLRVLNGLSEENNPVLSFYYGLIYSRDEKSYDKAVESYKKYLLQNPLSYEGNSNLGLLLYKMRKYKEAANSFRSAVEISSGTRKSTAFYRLSLCQVKLKKRVKAMANLNESIRLNPSNVKARRKLAGLLYEKNRVKGIKEYRKVLALDRSYSYGYYIIGKYFFDSEKPVRAIKTLREGLAVSPHADILQSYLGFIYLSLGEFKSSLDVYSSLVSEYPGNKLYHFNRARSYFGLKNHRMAAEEYLKALKIDSLYYKAVVNLGVTYSKMNDFINAVKYYKIAIKQKPDSPLIYYNLGVLFSKQGKLNRAERYFLKAIELDSGYGEAYFNLGYISGKKGDKRKVVEYYEKALGIDKRYILPYINLSRFYRNSGRTDKAIEILKRGIGFTGSSRLSGILGKLYYRKKRYDAALKVYEGILKSDRNNSDALLGIAWVYYQKKEYLKAHKNVARYIYFKPKEIEARYLMMLSLYRLKDYREAFENLKIVEKLKPSYRFTENYRTRILNNLKREKAGEILSQPGSQGR